MLTMSKVDLQAKILRSLVTNKLNPEILGNRNWYNYIISVDELVWARNLWDGYKIHVFTKEFHSSHLATYWLGYDYYQKPKLKVEFENIDIQ